MVQKILRTMQDDLRAIKEGGQQKNNPSKEEQREEKSPAQINGNLQQPVANQEEPQTLETEQKAPVLTNSNADSDGKNNRDEEIAKIREELENMPVNTITSVSINQEEERLEKERKEKELEDQRKKIEEMQKKAEEEARMETERKAREEAEKQKIEEEKARQEAEKLRLAAEEEARRREMEISEMEKERQEEDKKAEEEQHRIERERERIAELKKKEAEIEELKKRQERIKIEEEVEKKMENERKTREEEELQRREELKKKEEKIRKAEEEAKRQEEEIAKKEEEEIAKTEEEARRMEEEAERMRGEIAKKEEDLQKMENEEKERIEELIKNEEDMKEAEQELEQKEKELEQKEKRRKRREELRMKMRAEMLKEDLPEDETKKEENIVDIPQLTDKIAKNNELPSVFSDKDDATQIDKSSKESEKYPASSLYKIEGDMQSAPKEETYRQTPLPESAVYANNTQEIKGDEELSSLVKRVSKAMNATVKQEENTVLTAAQNPDKDKDIKELIARMSKNLKKEKKILEKEQKDKTSLRPDLAKIKTEQIQHTESEIEPMSVPEPKLESLPTAPDKQPEEYPVKEETASTESANPSQPSKEPSMVRMTTVTKTGLSQTERPVNSYWAELHDTLKNSADKSDIQTYTSPEETGLIVPKKTVQEIKQTEKFLLPKKNHLRKPSDKDYVDPENRLIFGKQEFYSSMHKKVKPKTWEANLEELKETVKEKEVKLSDEEEKKKLRHQIITKYKIELFSMPWAKIIIFSFLLLATLGITLYVLIPKFIPKEQVTEAIITGESIAEIDKLIPQKITTKQKEAATLNYFDSEIDPWKSLADGSIMRLIINNNEHEVMLPRDEALKVVLGEDNFNNVPQNILGFLDNEYDILAFKNNDVLRLGIVFKYNRNQEENFKQSMASWAETPAKAQKIHNVMKALFANSKVEEKSSTAFQPSSYNNVNIYYLNLPDTDTSMDYFMYKGYLVFTTSKSTTSEMIDLLQQ